MTACGRAHSLFLTKEGRLYACGFNEFGELGIDMGEAAQGLSGEAAVVLKCRAVPFAITLEPRIRFIAAGANHSVALSSCQLGGVVESDMYTWGLSAQG